MGSKRTDLRKDKATEYAVNMIKLTGHEVTPELEQMIRDTAEAAVFVMKQTEQKIDTAVPAQEQQPTVEAASESQPVIDSVQQTA